MAETCHQVLKDVGVNPDRMVLKWASAAEGPRFVELVTQYVASIKEMGPLGEGEGESSPKEIAERLEAAVKAAEVAKVRTSYGNVAKNLHKSGDYSPETIREVVEKKILPSFRKERINQGVIITLGDGPLSMDDLVQNTGGSQEEIESVLATLAKKGVVKEEASGWALAG